MSWILRCAGPSVQVVQVVTTRREGGVSTHILRPIVSRASVIDALLLATDTDGRLVVNEELKAKMTDQDRRSTSQLFSLTRLQPPTEMRRTCFDAWYHDMEQR